MSKKIKLKIHGMHCASCEVLIERKFQKIPGVEKVHVNHASGKAEIYCSQEPRLYELQSAIKSDGYNVSWWYDQHYQEVAAPHRNTKKDYFQIGAIFLIIVAAYLILKQFNLVPNLGISDNMSYGFVFLIGLVAAMSTCLAVTGGLLLAVAAKYNEKFPNLTSLQKLKPTLYFNVGRVVSYTVLGGAVGALGSVFTFSPKATGFLSIAASLVMIILGFQLLHLFPWMRRFQPKMPKFLAHKIHDISGKDSKSAPFLLGAATFFLPCGFTQALQLYVLATGSMMTGALTMLAFSLGTLPALMSLSAISSFAKGAFQRHFLKFSGVLVIMIGAFNFNNGLALTGSNFNLASVFASNSESGQEAHDLNVEIVNGKQIARMKVTGLDYYPHRFTVAEGIPVEWQIDGSEAQGCAQVLTAPALGITEYLPPTSIKKIAFTPKETGDISFGCSMGMTTRGARFTVVPNTTGVVTVAEDKINPGVFSGGCNPEIMDCIPAQKLAMSVTNERGFYPNTFTVKKNIPVELAIDDQVPLGGCMSVMVIPQYQVTLPLKLGENTLKFTPTEEGIVYATCSMGSKMVQFLVES